jgi:DNA-binding CsgD family transcriptional regulator
MTFVNRTEGASMLDVRGERPRRIGFVTASRVVPATRDREGEHSPERVLGVLAELGAMLRRGELAVGSIDGVLLDATVGDVHCVLVQQRPSIDVGLSPREQQVARMVADGRTNQAIAAALEISVWTVSTHLRRIFAKLAVSSRAEMVAHLRPHPSQQH